jgi:FO synthase
MATIPAARDLTVLSLDALMTAAAAVRDDVSGRRITWSPSVTIPLAGSCEDACGYCNSGGPRAGDAPFLEPEQILALAWQGAEAGCHEAVFTSRLAPDIDYLVAVCSLVLDETGLLPHTEVGVHDAEGLRTLRAVAPSQGVVLHGLDGDLADQFGAVEAAGALRIPLSVRLVLGAGEDRDDRVDVLRLLAEAHERGGHLQHVAFSPSAALERHELAETAALARLILPEDVSLQAAPIQGGDPAALLDAGVDDWGGLDPSEIEAVRHATEARAFALTPRLALRPRYAVSSSEWIDPALHFAVLDRSDADGFARDDPGAVLPHRFASRAIPGSGAEVTPIGPRSTAWSSGGASAPPVLLPARGAATGVLREVLDGVTMGQEVGEDELLTLFAARGPEVAAVCEVADDLRRVRVGDVVTFVRNRNINYASLENVVERVLDAARRGATEVCLQGGIHPELDGAYYLHLVQAVKAAAPTMHVHGFTAVEVFEAARRLAEPLEAYLRRLQAAGLGSLAGTPDEILDDQWLEVHRTAHLVGLRSNVTITFGTSERPRDSVRQLLRTRALQRETGGFTEFVPLPFVHMAAPTYLERRARRGPTFREALLMHAVGRIVYHGVLTGVSGSWVRIGPAGIAQVLQAGANDLGGTLSDELSEDDFRALVEPLGRPLEQRTTLYGRVGEERSG